jgi:hypothetical protein
MKKIIVRIKGGIGNQLFCYAAARRLAIENGVELVIDNITGFERDYQYNRKYMLDHFEIQTRTINKFEMFWPFQRYWLVVLKWFSKLQNYSNRFYLQEEEMSFDERLLTFKVKKFLYLDGYWQSELYFNKIDEIIRKDLRIIPPSDLLNQQVALNISKTESVAVHVRWFDNPGINTSHNVNSDYYIRAIQIIENKIEMPHYYIFSDNPEAAKSMLNIPENQLTLISHNLGDENAYADLWLMSQCRYFITANSTFSWWAAWLASFEKKIVLTPNVKIEGITSWGFKGLIPEKWIKV